MTQIQIPSAFRELFTPKRYKVYYGGRGGAKTWAFADALLLRAIQAPVLVLCVRELQKSIKESVHGILAAQIKRHGLQDHFEVLQSEIKGRNGSRFIFAGIRYNSDEIKGTEGVDVCWVEEAHNVTDQSWELLIPTIRKPGSEIWISFNPHNKHDATYQRFIINQHPDSTVRKVSWRDNPWFPDVLKREMEHLKATDYEDYLHVWEGEFRQFADGAIYNQQLRKAREEGRITTVPIDPICEVYTFWDLGRNDQTAIWFGQKVGQEMRFIDYYESRLVGLDHYVKVLKDKGYNYGTHYLPHDVEVTELSTNHSRREMLETAGIKPIQVVPRVNSVNEGIEMTRKAFAYCWFDKDRCERGLEALSNYQYVFDDKFDTFRQTPLHNWASNGADAFRQFGQGFNHSVAVTPAISERRAKAITRNTNRRQYVC